MKFPFLPSHLFYCEDFQCPSHFKCTGSYCIPIRHVCDGSQDCPYGEEETQCKGYSCTGLFRCPVEQLCLGFIDVCDGQLHCTISHDDEFLCSSLPCPEQCACAGAIIVCADFALFNSFGLLGQHVLVCLNV